MRFGESYHSYAEYKNVNVSELMLLDAEMISSSISYKGKNAHGSRLVGHPVYE